MNKAGQFFRGLPSWLVAVALVVGWLGPKAIAAPNLAHLAVGVVCLQSVASGNAAAQPSAVGKPPSIGTNSAAQKQPAREAALAAKRSKSVAKSSGEVPAAGATNAVQTTTQQDTDAAQPTPKDQTAENQSEQGAGLTGYARLADPTVADQLKLSADQRAKIAELLKQRESELKSASEEQKAAVLAKYDELLAAVLTEDQRAAFESGRPLPRLRFNFRFQRWEHVLQWLAEEAGLSLVIDAPPPGTFNYSDAREYTPTEAIDLLNSILLPKGYALVRRGQLLMVVNLRAGIPAGIVPRVSLEEAAKRGKFELVTVEFPLGRRSGETVVEAVKSLLSPFGEAKIIPGTGQLVVTDRAGVMESVAELLKAIPEQDLPPTPTTPETPELQVYPIEKADPEVAAEVLAALLPTAKIVLDAKLQQINAYATPSQHKLIKDVLAKMESSEATKRLARLEVYPLSPLVDTKGLLRTLQSIVPEAIVNFDTESTRLVVWARPDEHEKVKETLAKFGGGTGIEVAVQLEAYDLGRVDPKSVTELLQKLVPNARISYDAGTRKLFVLAVPSDQQIVRSTLEQASGGIAKDGSFEIKVYQLKRIAAEQMSNVLEDLLPGLEITVDSENNRLIIGATSAEHELIKNAIDQADAEVPPEAARRFEAYTLRGTRLTSTSGRLLLSQLEDLVPGVVLTYDYQNNKIIAYATDEQHKRLKDALAKLARGATPETTPTVKTYDLGRLRSEQVLTVLRELVPDAELSVDSQTGRLVALATAEEHQIIADTLKNLVEQLPEDQLPRFEILPVTTPLAQTVLSNIQALVPNAKITLDSKSGRLIIWGTPDDIETIRRTLQQLTEVSTKGSRTLQVYSLGNLSSTSALSVLQNLVPDAQLTVDAANKTLIAIADSDDHALIQATLEQLQKKPRSVQTPQVRYYPIPADLVDTALTVLRRLVPDAEITVDNENQRLLVIAPAEDQQIVQQTLEQLQKTAPPPEHKQLVVYRVSATARKRFEELLPELKKQLPGVTLLKETRPGELAIWAQPSEHQVLQQVIEQLDQQSTTQSEYTVVGYQLKLADPESVQQVLQQLFPDVEFIVDSKARRIMAVAPAEVQMRIKAAIDQIDSGEPGQWQQQLRVYPIDNVDAQLALEVLKELLPDVNFSTDRRGTRIVAWANDLEDKQIKEAIKKLETDVAPEEKPRIAVYPVKNFDATSLLVLLRSLVPEARVAVDSRTGGIAVWGSPEDHEAVKQALEELEKSELAAQGPTLKVYDLQGATVSSLLSTLVRAVPGARLAQGTRPNQLVAWAKPSDHEMIAKLIEELTGPQSPENAARLEVYTLEGTTATAAMYVLRQLIPSAVFTVGTDRQQLIAWATPQDHEKIKAAVENLNAQTRRQDRQLVVYNLENISASTAVQALRNAVPQAEAQQGGDASQLFVWATPEDHKIVEETLKKIDIRTVDRREPRVYTVEGAQRSSSYIYYLFRFLARSIPEAEFMAGADPNQIVAWAEPEVHERIAKLIDQLTAKAPPEKAPFAKVYALKNITALSAIEVLRAAVPTATFTYDRDDRYRLTVLATAADHAIVEDILSQIDVEVEQGAQYSARIYDVEGLSPSYALRWLDDVAPNARITLGREPNQIIAWATEQDHAKIAEALQQLTAAARDRQKQAVVYRLQWIDASTAERVLEDAVPQAEITREDDRLLVWATPEDHKRVDEVLKQIDIEEAASHPEVGLYSLEGMSYPANVYAIRLLREAVPDAAFTLSADGSQLVAFASAKDQETIKQIVEQLTAEEPPDKAPRIEVYTLPTGNVSTAISMLARLVPGARLAAGTEPGQIIAWARPRDHKTIASVLEKLAKASSPEAAPVVTTYRLQGIDASSALRFFARAFPDAEFSVSADGSTLIAFASPQDQQKIQEAMETIRATTATQAKIIAKVYTLQGLTTASQAMQLLQRAFPQARFAVGGDPQQLLVYASPEDHAKIAEAVDQLSASEDEASRPYAATYNVRTSNLWALYFAMRSAVPQAKFLPGARNDQVVVWARPNEHEIIRQIIDQINQMGTEADNKQVVAYTLRGIDAQRAIPLLQNTVPSAQFTVGSDPYRLIALASPEEHKLIAAAIEQIAKEDAASTQQMVVYDLGAVNASQLLSMLQAAVPGAKFGVGEETSQLIAWARPEDHRLIDQIVQRLREASPLGENRVMAVYPIPEGNAQALLQVLQPVLQNRAQFVVDEERNCLIVWADRKYHDAISRAVEEYRASIAGTPQMTSRVYRFQYADPYAAFTVLRSLVPNAQLAIDRANMSIVAVALPEDHAKIEATIREMDREDAEGQRPVVRVHRVTTADPYDVYVMLRQLFRYDPAVELSVDRVNDAVVAIAPPVKHETIEQLISEIEKGLKLGGDVLVQTYSLKNIDADAATQIIEQLMERRGGRAEVSVDPRTNQLVVIARPEEQKLIAETLEHLRGEEGRIEIIQLEEVDPYSARSAIESLFADEPNPPVVEVDYFSDQLVVRATDEQYQKILELLAKMGETHLAFVAALGGRAVEVVPYEGDVQSLLKQLEKVWPTMRRNRIRVVTPEQLQEQTSHLPLSSPAQSQAEVERPSKATGTQGSSQMSEEAAQQEVSQAVSEQQAGAESRVVTRDVKSTQQTAAPASSALVIYRLDRAIAPQAVELLRKQFPNARVAVGLEPTQVVVWADPSQHAEIQKLLQRLLGAGEDEEHKSQQQSQQREEKAAEKAEHGNQMPSEATDNSSAQSTGQGPSSAGKENAKKETDTNDKQPEPKASSYWVITAPVQVGNPENDDTDQTVVIDSPEQASSSNSDASNTLMSADQLAQNVSSRATNAAQTEQEQPTTAELPPVYIIPRDGRLTIVSEDPEAVRQLAGILRSLSYEGDTLAEDITVYELRYASAADVADKLIQFLRYGSYGYSRWRRFSSVVIVPDEKRNTLLVQADRREREVIEELLKIFDSPELPKALAELKPRIIPIKNADADNIRNIIVTLFRAQLYPTTSTSSRYGYYSRYRQTVNPLAPQITSDDTTNSLIVTGPQAFVDQVEEVAKMLDEAAGNQPARQVKVISLKSTNPERIEQALERIVGRRSSSYSSRSSYYYRRPYSSSYGGSSYRGYYPSYRSSSSYGRR